MSQVGRVAIAVLVGYLVNAALVAVTEHLLPGLIAAKYFPATDLATQCVYEVVAGYLCSWMARESRPRTAVLCLIALGLAVGAISLLASWKEEPHWYGIALLSVWAPCVWLGHLLRLRQALGNHSSR